MKINICFGITDSYAAHCGATMASILYNSNRNDDYNFFIITDFISKENKDKFKQLKKIRNFNLKYITIKDEEYKNIAINRQIADEASTLFILKAFEITSVDKILYLDVDLIVRHDIAELFQTDISEYACGGIENFLAANDIETFGLSKTAYYINAGVLLINLPYCRKINVSKQIQEFDTSRWQDVKESWGDQPIINFILQNKIKPIDITWNYIPYLNTYKDQKHFQDVAKNPSIIHYISGAKPWVYNAFPYKKEEYFYYLSKTPWYNEVMRQYIVAQNICITKTLLEIKDILKKK